MPARRTQLYLSEAQWKAVEEKARRLGTSAAEMIHQAIDQSLGRRPPLDDVLDRVAGAWAGLEQFDSAYLARIRAEWDRRTGD